MRVVKVVAALALALSLASCAEEPVPTPNPEPAPENPPAVIDDAQLESILTEVYEELAAADAEANAEKLSARVTGLATSLREAEYALSAITEDPVSAISTDPQLSVVAATDEWPRVVFVVTTVPEDANLPLMLALVQEDARAQYKLWSWVRLLPGTELPQTVSASIGSPPVAADSAETLISPTDTLAQYVDLMNEADESEYADSFAEDSFRTHVAQEVEDLDDAVSQAGEASVESAVNEDSSIRSLQTYDGGAIVFGSIRTEILVEKTVARGTLEVGEILAYGGDETITMDTPLTAHYLATIAFYVPPAGSDQQARVLGAEYVLADVTRGGEEEDDE